MLVILALVLLGIVFKPHFVVSPTSSCLLTDGGRRLAKYSYGFLICMRTCLKNTKMDQIK